VTDRPRAEVENQTEREEILSILAAQIRGTRERIDEYDVEDHDDEQLLIRWTRTLGYLSGQYRKLMKDTDLDEMEDELELLKAAKEKRDRR
jgi:hypothetical protein